MASQASQRVRRIASPSTKQGPIKATLTFGLKSSPTTTKSCGGSSSSPTSQRGNDIHRKTRRSPDNRASPDRNSPGSPGFKVEKSSRSSRHSPGPLIKRANSYDTIANTYLKSEWPRFTSEKATQTDDDWEDTTDRKRKESHKRSSSLGNGDNTKEKIKARLAKTAKEGSGRGGSSGVTGGRASPVAANHHALGLSSPTATAVLSKAVCIPYVIPKSGAAGVATGGGSVRGVVGSVEGLNQEIEKLVLSTHHPGKEDGGSPSRTREPTPDGHRAPVLELLLSAASTSNNTRTAVTQTPSALKPSLLDEPPCVTHSLVRVVIDEHSSSSGSSDSSRSQSAESPSLLPIIAGGGTMDGSRPSSRADSDTKDKDFGDSLSFVREPPDGCEKVVVEDARVTAPSSGLLIGMKYSCSHAVVIPSQESAFCPPLYRSYMTQPVEMALTTPSSGTSPITAAIEIQQ